MNAADPQHVAVDLGAGSGRVILARLSPERFLIQEVRRFRYEPIARRGRLTWPAARIFDEIKAGLRDAATKSERTGSAIRSIGVDAWGVDYGLIDADGNLCGDPVCYRDSWTEGVAGEVFARLGREEIYARTGIQFLRFNTLFQLAAHTKGGIPRDAAHLLLIPDLVHFLLTGRISNEFTNASTTQMLDIRTGDWDREMLHRLDLPTHLLGEIVPAGTILGELKPELGKALGLEGTRVVAPATHDTASAVAGTPLEDGFAFISSGTWSLAGVELDHPIVDSATARLDFTNEGGAFSTTRFLKNVMGLWIFESCRKEWRRSDLEIAYDELLNGLDTQDPAGSLIFPDDPRFLAPETMSSALAAQMKETNQSPPADPAAWTKVILDSLAFRYASVVGAIEQLTGRAIAGIHVVGGGSQNDYLNQVTATASGRRVVAGPVEATAIGNVLVQAIRCGRFATLGDARRYVRENVELREFIPRPSSSWSSGARRYAAIEARYTDGPG